MENTLSDYERLGGEPALRRIIDHFVGTVFDDVMIGFFFRRANRQRIAEMEFQLAAQFLGAPITYSGRPLGEAHRSHRIMGGQFARRKQLLKQSLEHFLVPQDIVHRWLAHTESLRAVITDDPGDECQGEARAIPAGDKND